MDFHGMKRKDLQILCKKHGIPGNLKNIEMASRLASIFEKETVIEKKISPEDSGIKDNIVASGDAKKVSFSPETEVFEFTRSVKKRRRNNVTTRSQEPAQYLQQGGIELRRTTRSVAKGITVAGSSETESSTRKGIFETEKECTRPDVTKAHKVPRRSKRIGSSGSTHVDCEVTELMALDQAEDRDIAKGLSGNELQMEITNHDGFKLEKVGRRSTRLTAKSCVGGETSKSRPVKRSKRLVATDNKEVELVKNTVKEVSMDLEVQETGKNHRNDVQDDPKVENVPRRSKRFVNVIDVQTNTHDQRRSTRRKTNAEKPSIGGGESDCRPLCSAKESKEERKAKESKGFAAVNSLEGEPVKNKTKESAKVQDVSKVEKVTRRSKRLGNIVDEPLVDENVEDVKRDDLEVEKAPKQSMQLENSIRELVDGQVHKSDKQPKSSSGNDGEGKKLLRRSKRTGLDNSLGQTMSNLSKECSVVDNERDGASSDNVKKSNANDEMQARVRSTRNSLRHDTYKAPIVVEGNLIEKKTNETLDSLVESSKRVTRRMKRGRSAEPRISIETAVTQSNLTAEKLLDSGVFEQEEAGGTNVEVRGSSKKSKPMNQECVKDKPQGVVKDSTSSSETKAKESVVMVENVLESTPEKSVDNSQRTNTQELNSELMEEESEHKLEQDTVLIAAVEKEKEAGGTNVEVTGSSEKSETMNQECVKDMPQGVVEDSPSSSEIKATEPFMISENVLDSLLKVSGDLSLVRNTQELNSELVDGEHEQGTVLMTTTKKDQGEASSMSELLIEYSKVTTCPDNCNTDCFLSVETTPAPASVQLAMGNPESELSVPTVHIFVNDSVSTVITIEDIKTKQETPNRTPRSELEKHSTVSKLTEVEAILENKAECCKEIHSSKDEEKGSVEKDLQAANLDGNFFEYNIENSSAGEEMEIGTVGCSSVGVCVNLTPEKPLDSYNQLESEEKGDPNVEVRGSSKKMKTVNQECVNKPQGIVEESPFTSKTKASEPIIVSENVFDSTPESSVGISPRRNSQELNLEITKGECEEKPERDTVLMDAFNEKEEASSLYVAPIESSEVSSPEAELFSETAPPLASVYLAVSYPEAELGMPTGHILVKDIASTVTIEEHNETKEEILSSIPKSELKEHSFVAKLAEVEAILETSAECWKEIHSSKYDEKSFLEKEIQASNLHGNFSEYNTGNSSAEEQAEINKVGRIRVGHCVNLETLDEVKDDNLERTISSERGWSTGFPSLSPEEKNVSKCFEEDGMKALSQPIPVTKDSSSGELNESALFTTPERNLLLMEQLSENGMTRAADSVTHHNDKAVESHAVVFTTPEQVLLLGDSELDEAGKEGEHATSLERHELFGCFGKDQAREGEQQKTGKFSEESRLSTGLHKYQLLADSELGEAGWQETSGVNKSGLLTNLERKLLYGDYEHKKAINTGEKAAADSHDEYAIPNISERHAFPGDSKWEEAVKSEANKAVELRVDCNIFTAAEKHLLLDTVDSNGRNASKVSYNHQFNAGQETASAKFMPKGSQAENVAGLDAIEGTLKQSRRHSPHVASANLFHFDIEEAEKILEEEGDSETEDEIPSHLEVAGTCSMVSEESGSFTEIPKQKLEEFAITDELIEAKVTTNIQKGCQGNFLLDSSGGFYASGKTSVLAAVFDSILTEKTISPTPDESTVEDNKNEKETSANEEMVRREATPSREETINQSSENRKEHLNVDESGMLSEKQVRREPSLIYRTQAKPKRHDMKENASNSKIVHNLNITAPRISKRQPLQDLRKI